MFGLPQSVLALLPIRQLPCENRDCERGCGAVERFTVAPTSKVAADDVVSLGESSS